jgi:hypothetical protein
MKEHTHFLYDNESTNSELESIEMIAFDILYVSLFLHLFESGKSAFIQFQARSTTQRVTFTFFLNYPLSLFFNPPFLYSLSHFTMVIGKDKTVAIVTGANAGIGYGICKRLLESVTDLVLIMACRSPTRAKEAKDSLLMEYPNAHIDIELVDVANVKTVFSFCKTIQEK